MGEEKETKWTDSESLLEELFEKHSKYFVDERYKFPTSRYEAWLIANTLSNLVVAKALKELLDQIFQKGSQSIIIKEEKLTENKIIGAPLKRRKIR